MAETGTLNAGWTLVKFGEVVKLNRDRVTDPASEGLERYVGLEHIDPRDLRVRRWGLVAEGTTFTSRFRPGQVLFGAHCHVGVVPRETGDDQETPYCVKTQ